MQSIQAATINAEDLLGWSDRVGSIEGGRFDDNIAVNGDPTADIMLLEHVAFVIKGRSGYGENAEIVVPVLAVRLCQLAADDLFAVCLAR